jgi:Flp pilus assembly protein CpaB
MKGKLLPIILAIVIFVAALVMLQPAPSTAVLIAAYDLPAGRILADGDVVLRALPADAVPPDALTDLSLAIGQAISIDRGQGDVIRESQLGDIVRLQANERAIAVKITDDSGLSGLLSPGMEVGIVASITEDSYDGASGSFTKSTIEGVRVMYLDPRFEAQSPDVARPEDEEANNALSGNTVDDRAREGTVILAVPVEMQSILYDYTTLGGVSETRQVNTIELLAGLGATDSATLTLYLMPGGEAQAFSSPGLWLPDLARTPVPTATPTITPTLSAAQAATATASPEGE